MDEAQKRCASGRPFDEVDGANEARSLRSGRALGG